MLPGLDLLGLMHPLFPFDKLINEVPRDTPIGWFWNTFGPSENRLKKMLQAGFHTFRPQMWWSDSHTIVPMAVLAAVLDELTDVTDNVQCRLYVSPSCEHAERNANEVKKRLELVKQVLPYATPINNPWKGHGANVPGYLHEYHGSNPGACDSASTDGTNIYDINAVRWVRRHGNKEHPCFLWGARFNLREIGDPGQKPPPISNRKAAPSVEYLRSILRLAEPIGSSPKPGFKSNPFKAPNIYKTHAEDDQEPDEDTPDELRENRPVLIVKFNGPSVDIIDFKGKLVGKLPRYGSYPGNLTRYYSGMPGGIGLYGYEIGEKAKKQSESEFVWFRAGKNTLGPVHPAFRAGVFRE